MRIHLALFAGMYVWLIPCEKEVFLVKLFIKDEPDFCCFLDMLLELLLELYWNSKKVPREIGDFKQKKPRNHYK